MKVVNIADYKEGKINNYDYVFVMGIEGELNKKTFIKDLKNYNKKNMLDRRRHRYLLAK